MIRVTERRTGEASKCHTVGVLVCGRISLVSYIFFCGVMVVGYLGMPNDSLLTYLLTYLFTYLHITNY